ncbi:MAG TPA: hypothetical protein VGA63_15270 [Geopsychrobacteraceae bacterium]
MDNQPTKLGEMLLQAGLIDQFQLESALSYQRNVGGRIGSALVKLGYIAEQTILDYLGAQSRFPRIDLQAVTVARAVLSMIPAAKLYKCMAFPVELRKDGAGKSLVVAMTDPTNLLMIDDLQFMAGCRVVPVVAAEAEILSALNRHFAGGNPLPSPPPADFDQIRLPGDASAAERLDRLLALLQEKGILTRREADKLK